MWPTLFDEARANGLNAISSYVFWNWHMQTHQGPPDYTGAGNVTHFLALAKQKNLFVLWRLGPYVCAEWPAGGIPGWIHDIDGMKTRSNNEQWLAEVEKWATAHFTVIEPFL